MDWRTPTLIAGFACSILAIGIAVGSRQPRSQPASTASGAATESPAIETYRGYRIDASAVRHQTDLPEVLGSLRAQLDIVEGVRLDAKVRNLFHAIPVTLVSGSTPGARYLGRFGIQVDGVVQPPEKPVLLHAYLLAFQTQVLSGGTDNPDVLGFYRRAVDGSAYPRGAEVLSDVREFFAITASAFLHGRETRPPFTRAELCRAQSDYCDYLTTVFGEPAEHP